MIRRPPRSTRTDTLFPSTTLFRSLNVAVLDLRWLSPIDDAAIAEIVARTGRVLVVHEASQTGGFGAEIAARISERHDAFLRAPVRRLGSLDVRMPASPALQNEVIPTTTKIVAILRDLVSGKTEQRQVPAARTSGV